MLKIKTNNCSLTTVKQSPFANSLAAVKGLPKTIALLALTLTLFSSLSQATTVQVQTTLGNFEINLFDDEAPLTVANFLSYVEGGDYTSTIIHRSVDDFVIQGGGYALSNLPPEEIDTKPPVVNEPIFSNVRGTISMAKISGQPNSATSQWFFNLKDNSSTLDANRSPSSNGGFSVFGIVTGSGMDVVDAIAALDQFNTGDFGSVPLRDFSSADLQNNVSIDRDNYVEITNIVVLDAATNTASDLNRARQQSNNGGGTGGDNSSGGSSGGGGTMSWPTIALLFSLLTLAARRRSNC